MVGEVKQASERKKCRTEREVKYKQSSRSFEAVTELPSRNFITRFFFFFFCCARKIVKLNITRAMTFRILIFIKKIKRSNQSI